MIKSRAKYALIRKALLPRRPIFILAMTLCFVFMIVLKIFPYEKADLSRVDEKLVTFTGRVSDKSYKEYDDGIRLLLTVKDINIESNLHAPELRGAICYIPIEDSSAPEPGIGSYVRIRGKVRAISEATNPGEFNSALYYDTLGIQARVTGCSLKAYSSSYNYYYEGLCRIKRRFETVLDESSRGDEGSILKAMLLGDKSSLDDKLKSLYQENGIVHILSISGLHISIIGMGLFRLLQKCRVPLPVNIPVCLFVMFSYGIMTGMAVSSVRALIMFFFSLCSGLLKRTYDMITSMSVAALIVLLDRPYNLFNSGFLFSFGSILAIGYVMPIVSKQLPEKLRKYISPGLSISLLTFPMYMCIYFEYPMYSILINLLIIPSMTIVVISGLAGVFGGLINPLIGTILVFPARILLIVYEYLCRLCVKLPLGKGFAGKPDDLQVVIFLIIFFSALVLHKQIPKIAFWEFILTAMLILVTTKNSDLEITVIDVGQGDGIYIHDDSGGNYLIDGGSSNKSDVGKYQILPFLKSRGAGKLDAIFVTHMDSDHYNGIPEILKEYEVDYLVMPDIDENCRDESYRELVDLAGQLGTDVFYISTGNSFTQGSMTMTCLYPEAGWTGSDTNGYSLTMFMRCGNFTALFAGDLEGDGEEKVTRLLADNPNLKNGITFLKVAHHGSKNSTDMPFLEVARPGISVISAGRNNRYGHPHPDLIDRLLSVGSAIYKTPTSGAITLRLRKETVYVETFLANEM